MIEQGFKTRFKYHTAIPFAFYRQRPCAVTENLIAHQHKELELIAMIEGAADFYVDSVHHALSGGDVLVIPPCSIHRATVAPGARYDCTCFDLSILGDVSLRTGLESGHLGVSSAIPSAGSHTAFMSACIKDAISAFETADTGWELEVIGQLSLLFSALKKEGVFVKSEAADEKSFEKSVLDYVAAHFREPITSNTVAATLYINNSYFCRVFKLSFGCCFTDFLLEYRIEQAKFHLYNSDRSISEISSSVGFNSFSYFSKTFKRLVGSTPSDYRARCTR